MRWEAPIDDVRPLMDRQNSDTTQSDSSLETQCESPLGQTTINDTLSELFSTIPDLDLVTRSPDTASQQNLLLRYRGYSSLTIAQVQALEKIAMPNGIKAWEQPSPSQSTVASPSETEAPKTKKSIQKRKHSRDKEPGFASGDVSLGQSKREGHNTIEKRYRANLNDKIYLLGQSIPNLTAAQKGEIEIDDQENGANPLPDKEKYSKAVIIMRAVQYITYLETQNKKVGQQAFSLNTRVEAFEKLAKSGSFDKDSASGVEASDTETLESIRNGKYTKIKLDSML